MLKNILICSTVVLFALYFLVNHNSLERKTKDKQQGYVKESSLESNHSLDKYEDPFDTRNTEPVKMTKLLVNDEGFVELDPSAGMLLVDDDPLLLYIKDSYEQTSMKRGIENQTIPYQASEKDPIYGSNKHVYRVMEDANGDWHLFPFNYQSAHMFSQAEQLKYLDSAPESPLEIKHAYIESTIKNVVYMHGGRNLDISCKNNVCIGSFNRALDAKTMWIIGNEYAEELMNEVIDRDPYVVGMMNCDIMGVKPLDKEPDDKKDCYIEVRAVYDPTGS